PSVTPIIMFLTWDEYVPHSARTNTSCDVGANEITPLSIVIVTISLKDREIVPFDPFTVIRPFTYVTSTPVGIVCCCFPTRDIIFYQILNNTSPPTCSFRASLPERIPFGVESTSIP